MRAISDEELQIRRIAAECQHCVGMIRHPNAGTNGTFVRVEVEWAWTDDPSTRDISGGYYRVVVPTIPLIEGMSDDEVMEIHPATMAENLVRKHFARRRDQRRGYFWWQIDDISSF